MRKKPVHSLADWLLPLGIAVAVCLFCYCLSLMKAGFSPFYGDEFFYFQNARNFAENKTLQASFTYGGTGSYYLGTDAHGPAYPLLYGLTSSLTGWHKLTIPLVNFLVFLASLYALYRSGRGDKSTVWLQLLFVSGSPIALFYAFTFMPELLHLAGGVWLYVMSRRYLVYQSLSNFIGLLATVLVLGFFRSTWFFALLGIMAIPGPIKGYAKLCYALAAVVLAYLHQHFLHEQVPNAFTQALGHIRDGSLGLAADSLLFNLKRNLYFTAFYTEGWFYTLQKAFIVLAILAALLLYRRDHQVRFGLAMTLFLAVFNLLVYKNYGWVELRILSPVVLFLVLAMVKSQRHRTVMGGLAAMNFGSLLLILPLVSVLISIRNRPSVHTVSATLKAELERLDSPLVYVDQEVLESLALYQLPVKTESGRPIRYILPYYEHPGTAASHQLVELSPGQFSACPKKILCQ